MMDADDEGAPDVLERGAVGLGDEDFAGGEGEFDEFEEEVGGFEFGLGKEGE